MKYPLQGLESLVKRDLYPLLFNETRPLAKVLYGFINKAEEEKSQVEQALKNDVFKLKDDKVAERLVKQYQDTIINLADEVVGAIQKAEGAGLPNDTNEIQFLTVYQNVL